MKRVLLAFALTAIGFGAGWAAAVAAQRNSDSEFSHAIQRFHAESSVVFALSNIRYAQSGNIPAAIAMNCQIARSSLQKVMPGAYSDPNKRREIAALAKRGQSVVSSLESTGHCRP